jgi:transposase
MAASFLPGRAETGRYVMPRYVENEAQYGRCNRRNRNPLNISEDSP